MNKAFAIFAAGTAILVATPIYAQSLPFFPAQHPGFVLHGTGSDRGFGSLYDASPANGTNRYQQPPEGEQGTLATSTYGDVPQKPPGN